MIKSGQRYSHFIFAGCLVAVLTWKGQEALTYSLNWDPGPAPEPGLLFTAQDSLAWASIAAHDKTFAERPANEKNVIDVFDKLVYQALLEKCRGNAPGSQAHFQRAELAADYFGKFFDNPLLSEYVRFYGSMAGDALKAKLVAERFYFRGYESFNQGKFAEAENALDLCRRLYAEIQDAKRTADIAFLLAFAAFAKHDYSRCLDLALAALDKANAGNWIWQIKWLHWLMGEVYCNLSKYGQARSEFGISLNLAESGKDTLFIARVYERLGVTFWRQGDLLQALHAVQRSQLLSRQIRNQYAEINSLILLGIINRGLGNYAEASQWYEKAYELNQTLAQRHLNSVIASNRAFLCIELGDWERALDLQMKALQSEKAEPNPLVRYLVTYYSNIGLIYSNLHDHPKALEYQKLALRELEKTTGAGAEEALAYLRMGDAYRAMGQRQETENCYQTALAIAECTKETAPQVLGLLGLSSFYRDERKFNQALTLQKQAAKLAQQTQSPDLEWNAAFELGKTYEALQFIDLAQSAYERALEKVEISRTKISSDTLRTSFFACKQDVYDRLMLLSLDAKNDPEAALHLSEQSRARTMLDIMGERFSKTGLIPRLADLQSLMTPEMVFVEYKLLPDKLLVWVVKKNGLEVVSVSLSRQELTQLVQDFLVAIGASGFEKFRKRFSENPQRLFKESSSLGERLYSHLVAPIEKHLSDRDVIYFIPDDVLHYLPFAALTVPGADSRQFLLEKYKIAYMPSLNVYNYLAKRQNNKPVRSTAKILVIGNPTGDLGNSEKEAQSIAELFATPQILLRAQAGKQEVINCLQSDIDYFHFAGHCRLNTKSPMYSALLLSENSSLKPLPKYDADGTNGVIHNGMLTVQELLNFSLEHIELVTLSACETALGKLFKGEGMMGFNHALLGNGIATLVSTLWKVDDRFSAELMQRFYYNLSTGKYGKLEALRQAQLDKIAWCRHDNVVKYPFPYYWASYILSGMTQQ
jgi:CHAT domain-containing protein